MATINIAGRAAAAVTLIAYIPGVGARAFSLAKGCSFDEEFAYSDEFFIGEVRKVEQLLQAVDVLFSLNANHRFDKTLRQEGLLPTDGQFHTRPGHFVQFTSPLDGATLAVLTQAYTHSQRINAQQSATVTTDVAGKARRLIDEFELQAA